MGILTRQQGDKYVISSDRTLDAAPTTRAPRWRPDIFQVWTGSVWSTETADALNFDSIDDADEYVKAHYVKIAG